MIQQQEGKLKEKQSTQKDAVLASICCITYNHEEYIRDCIEGFLMQEVDFPMEIIIHDDASTDGTTDIVREYAAKHPNLIFPIFQKENQFSKGKKPFINLTLPHAKGKYIAICEGDDYWTDPLKLQKQVEFLEANPDYVISYHNAMIVDEDGNIVDYSKLPENLKKDLTSEELIRGTMILTLTMCFRNVLKEFPDELFKVYNGDKFLTSLLGSFGKGKYMSEIANAIYRKHAGAIWSSLDKVTQQFYNGDTRAWLHRYYSRIGQDKHADFFKNEAIIHFISVLKNIASTGDHAYERIVREIFSRYKDIIDNDTERRLRKVLRGAWTLYLLERYNNKHTALSPKENPGRHETAPDATQPIDIEYFSCSYIENAIAFYYDNLIYTCCYPYHINEEGIIGDLSEGRFDPSELIARKKEIISRRMRNELGGCSSCPRLIKKNWRQNWDFTINHINLNHLLTCNLKCSYCGYVDKRGKVQPTKTDAIIHSIQQLEASGLLARGAVFYIGNGEPSINKEMDVLIQFLMSKNYRIVIHSNGTKYKELYASGVNAKKIRLTLTPDAGNEASYKKMKGKDFFHTVWANIKRYSLETNGQVTVKTIMQEENVDDVESIVDLCEESGVKNIVVDVDINIRDSISERVASSIDRFVKYSRNKNLIITLGLHWPKEIVDRFSADQGEDFGQVSTRPLQERKSPFCKTNHQDALVYNLAEKGWQIKYKLYEKVFESCTEFKKVESPTVSIVVISWRLHPDNLRNFQILGKQRNQNYELIFVDNGSKPGEFEPLKPFVDTYVRLNTNTGAYLARNVGAVFAKAPILIFLEDDGIPEHDFVEAHLRMHRKYDVIAVRGVYIPKTETPLNKMAAHYYLGDLPYPYPSNLEGNCSYRSDIFYAVGGWDDDIVFGYGGWELAIRLLEKEPDQTKQIYSPDPVIYHDFATSEAHLAEKRRKQESSLQRLKKKHHHWDAVMNSWLKYIRRYDLLILKDTPYNISEIERFMGEGQHAEAITRLSGILSERPLDASVHNLMGIVHLRSGNKESALEHFQAAVRLEPQNPAYLKNLAGVYVDLQRLKEAADIYQRVIQSYPTDTDSLLALASFCKLLGRPGDSVQYWEVAVRVDPENDIAVRGLLESDRYRFDYKRNTESRLGTETDMKAIGKGRLSDVLREYEEGRVDEAGRFLEDYIHQLTDATA